METKYGQTTCQNWGVILHTIVKSWRKEILTRSRKFEFACQKKPQTALTTYSVLKNKSVFNPDITPLILLIVKLFLFVLVEKLNIWNYDL